MIQGAMTKCKQMPLHKQIATLIAIVLLTAFTIWNTTIYSRKLILANYHSAMLRGFLNVDTKCIYLVQNEVIKVIK